LFLLWLCKITEIVFFAWHGELNIFKFIYQHALVDKLQGGVHRLLGGVIDGFGIVNDGFGIVSDGFAIVSDGFGIVSDGFGIVNDGFGIANDGFGNVSDYMGVLDFGLGIGECGLARHKKTGQPVLGFARFFRVGYWVGLWFFGYQELDLCLAR